MITPATRPTPCPENSQHIKNTDKNNRFGFVNTAWATRIMRHLLVIERHAGTAANAEEIIASLAELAAEMATPKLRLVKAERIAS